jgi:hypothetical protein
MFTNLYRFFSHERYILKGAVPYPLIRTYSSSGAFERPGNIDLIMKDKRKGLIVQGGWSWLPHLNLFYESSDETLKIYLPELSGNLVMYECLYAGKNDLLVFKPRLKNG